jgi:two pore calcium channel protein 1
MAEPLRQPLLGGYAQEDEDGAMEATMYHTMSEHVAPQRKGGQDAPPTQLGGAAAASGRPGAAAKDGELEAAFTMPHAADKYELEDAALFVFEGEHFLRFRFHPTSREQRAAFRLLHFSTYNAMYLLEVFFGVLLMALALVENPRTFDLPRGLVKALEVLCYVFLAANLHLRATASAGWRNYLTSAGNIGRVAALLLCIGEFAVASALGDSSDYLRPLRVLRPYFFMDAHLLAQVRRVLTDLVHTLWVILDMVLLLFVYVLIWSIFGLYLFTNHEDNNYFDNLKDSFVNLFVSLTTSNYPDIMMPAFARSRYYAFFFVLYMGFGMYFVLNLFLALVYERYTHKETVKFKLMLLHQRRALRRAFCIAAGGPDHELGLEAFVRLMQIYKPHLPRKDVLLAFEYMDRIDISAEGSRNKTLCLEEFYRLFEALKLSWELDERATMGATYKLRPLYSSPALQQLQERLAWVESPYFEYGIRFLIFLNFIIVVVRAALSEEDKSNTQKPYEYVFLSVYVVEAMLKLFVMGTKAYFARRWNVFDFSIVFASLVGVIVQSFLSTGSSAKFGVLLRTLRLTRLLRVRETFRHVLTTMAFLTRNLLRYVLVLICVNYIFGVIGMNAFYHTVSTCTAAECGAYFDPSGGHYQLINFDNIM